jgi:signal transduction histidine kinase
MPLRDVEKIAQENDMLAQELLRLEAAVVNEQRQRKRQEKTFKVLQLLTQEISTTSEIARICHLTVKALSEKVGFDRTAIFKIVESGYLPIAHWGYTNPQVLESSETRQFHSEISQNRNILVTGKTRSKFGLESNSETLQAQYFIAVPFGNPTTDRYLLFLGNQTEGTLKRPTLTPTDLEIFQTLADQISLQIAQIELYAQAEAARQEAQQQAQQLQITLHQLQKSQAQMVQSEKMSALGNLVAGVAHEINNPIGFLNGSLHHLQGYMKDLLGHLALYQQHYPNPATAIQENTEEIDLEYVSEDLPKILNSMQGATDRIKGISVSLRTFSRADTDRTVQANLHEGLDSTLLILKYRIKANEHRPEIKVVQEYAQLPLVECFPGQLNQVFMNILANAIDIFDEMAQTQSFEMIQSQTITIRTAIVHQHIHISIADNAGGMSEAVKAKIFDHLFTTKDVGKGTGLGLAIAKQIIVETHGGHLRVDSELGRGTVFTIEIPIVPRSNSDATKELFPS